MKIRTLISSLVVGALANTAFAADWELQTTEENLGIEVYTRDVGDSPLKEFKGVTHLNSGLKPVVALIDDAENLPKWMFNMASSKILKQISPTESIGYSVTTVGPFIDDRDSIVHTKISQDETTKVVTISMSNKPDYLPAEDGMVRVSQLNGFWKLTPKDDGTTEVVYQLHADPAGSLPESIINAFVVDEPLNTLTGMHKQIGFYLDKPVPYVSEK